MHVMWCSERGPQQGLHLAPMHVPSSCTHRPEGTRYKGSSICGKGVICHMEASRWELGLHADPNGCDLRSGTVAGISTQHLSLHFTAPRTSTPPVPRHGHEAQQQDMPDRLQHVVVRYNEWQKAGAGMYLYRLIHCNSEGFQISVARCNEPVAYMCAPAASSSLPLPSHTHIHTSIVMSRVI